MLSPVRYAYRRCPPAGPAWPIRSSAASRPTDQISSSTVLLGSLIRAAEDGVVSRAGAPGARLGLAAGSECGTSAHERRKRSQAADCDKARTHQKPARCSSHLHVARLRLLLEHPLLDQPGSKLGAAQLPRRLIWVAHDPGRVRRDRHAAGLAEPLPTPLPLDQITKDNTAPPL